MIQCFAPNKVFCRFQLRVERLKTKQVATLALAGYFLSELGVNAIPLRITGSHNNRWQAQDINH